MGLQVWLPLNGNTKQQGVSGITMTGSPNSWVNGKIGQCAHFEGNTSSVIYNNTSDFNYTDDFSWAIWVKTNYTGSTAQYIFTNGRADAGGYGYGLSCSSTTNCSCRFGNSSWSIPVTGGEWIHLTFTKNGTTIKIYKNGILYNTYTFSGTLPTYSDGNGLGIGCFHYSSNIYPFYGDLNDFRIYDHCLSPREVKEISKGLVLHYPLAMPGQENLLQGSRMDKDTTKNWEWYGVNNTINRKFDNNAYYFETNNTGTVNNSYCMRVDRNAIGVQVGDTLTISMDIRGTIAGESYLQIMSTTPSSTNFWAYSTRGTNPCSFGNTIKEDVFQRYSLTFILPESHSTNTYFYIFPSIGFNSHIWYRNVKLERGSIATPWMPKIIGQDNLFDFEPIASKWAAESCTVANYFDSKWGNALQVTTTQANQRIYKNVSNVWEADTVYTVSFLAKASIPVQCNMSRSIADFSPTFNLNTEWRRYTGIISSTQTVSGGTLSFRLLTAGTVYITNITLEKGDTTLAYDGFDNVEYDVSGFGYNGIKFGILTYSSDTLIYNTSTIFNGTNNCIKFPFNDFCINGDIFTMNIWWKKTELGTKNYETLIGGPGGFEMDTRSGAAQALSLYMASTRGGTLYSPFNMNEWYMITLVNDGTNELYYVNGVLVNTIAKKNMPSGNYYVGAWSNETGQNFKGSMSDFRFYKTALSADDIIELYHTPISLSNNGTFLTQGEYVES